MKLGAIELEQKKNLLKLNNFLDFYLVGGITLALQVGHRISVDEEFFKKEIKKIKI